jgi:hypothetical protein
MNAAPDDAPARPRRRFYDPTTKSLDVRRWLRDESFEGDHGQDVAPKLPPP